MSLSTVPSKAPFLTSTVMAAALMTRGPWVASRSRPPAVCPGFADTDLVAQTLTAITNQRLVRKLCIACRQAYRPDTGLSAGKQKGSAGNDRGTFTVTDWWTLGWNNGGDWYNYTRTFPNTTYKIYGRFASGGADARLAVESD